MYFCNVFVWWLGYAETRDETTDDGEYFDFERIRNSINGHDDQMNESRKVLLFDGINYEKAIKKEEIHPISNQIEEKLRPRNARVQYHEDYERVEPSIYVSSIPSTAHPKRPNPYVRRKNASNLARPAQVFFWFILYVNCFIQFSFVYKEK